MRTERTEMFADHAQVLYELRIKFPVTHEDDLVILMKNHKTYHKWLETYSVEGPGAERLEQQGTDYSRVLDKIEAWISIPTHSFAAQNIQISGYQDVYVDFAHGIYSGDFFVRLCLEHVKNEAWLFAYEGGLGSRSPQGLLKILNNAREKTEGFVSRVNTALGRMTDDWTLTSSNVRELDFDSLHQKLSNLLLQKKWNLFASGCEQGLNDVYVCVGGLVGHLPTSTIMWAWNTAVSLMMDPVGQEKTWRFDAFIATLHDEL